MKKKATNSFAAFTLCFCLLISLVSLPLTANAYNYSLSNSVNSTPLSYPAGSTSEETVFYFLTGTMGLNVAAACGIMANIDRESGFRADASGGGSYGICQWRSSRLTALKNFCNANGYDWQSLTGQLYFLQSEISDSYPSLLTRLRELENTAEGAYTAGYLFCYEFERPGNTEAVSVERGTLAKEEFWPKYMGKVGNNSSIPSAASTPSNSSSSSTTSGSSTTTALPDGTYLITSKGASQMALSVAAQGTPKSRDNVVISQEGNSNVSQIWTLEKSGSSYFIHTENYDAVINIKRTGTPRSGDDVDIRNISSGDLCQLWKLECINSAESTFVIRSAGNEQCALSATGSSGNSNVNVQTYSGAALQQWVIQPLLYFPEESTVTSTTSYEPVSGDTIIMRLNAVKAILDGAEIAVDPTSDTVAPFTLIGKTMVPVRFVENLGADVKYNGTDKPVTVTYGNIELTLEFGKDTITKTVSDGESQTINLQTVPSLVEGKTCVPIREVAEGLGFSVIYDSGSHVIVVSVSSLTSEELDEAKKQGKENLSSFVEGVQAITASRTEYTAQVGDSIQLSKSNITFTPTEVGCNKLLYSSDNDSIATVSSNGKIKAVAKGTATITVSSHNGETTTIKVIIS